MKERIALLIVFFTGALLVAWGYFQVDPTKVWHAIFIALGVNMISTPIYVALVEVFFNFKKIPLLIRSRVLYRNKYVRLSISYLFRIKVGDKYLLVRNRKSNYYQLVGGAYKTLPGAEKIFQKYKVKPDNRFVTDHGIAKNDLRFRVPGKYVLDIIQWFESREDRETSQWREFCEELLTTNILDKHEFRYIDYNYACTVQTPMRKAKKLDCQEILIFEVFDLIPTDEQRRLLLDLESKGDSDIVKWADETIITNLGFDLRSKETEYDIGAHTKWAILEKWTDD